MMIAAKSTGSKVPWRKKFQVFSRKGMSEKQLGMIDKDQKLYFWPSSKAISTINQPKQMIKYPLFL